MRDYSFRKVIGDEVRKFLRKNSIEKEVKSEELVSSVLSGVVYREFIVSGKKLILFRLYSSVTPREEVFIGSVLLNAFISKNLLLAAREKNLGDIALIANDVENFYYLWFTDRTIEDLKNAYMNTLAYHLEDMYFSSRDEEKGIYGDFYGLFNFHKNNIEAFPIFAIPTVFVDKLGKLAREYLKSKIQDFDFSSNPTTISANMAFFLSKSGDEFQSPYVLLARSSSIYEDLNLSQEKLKIALNLNKKYDLSNNKELKAFASDIKNNLGKLIFSPAKLKEYFIEALERYEVLAKTHPDEWNMKYSRAKMLDLSPEEVVKRLLGQVQLGHVVFQTEETVSQNTYCRCCGENPAYLMENHIIMGEDVGKFHNQIVNSDMKNEIKICVKCCIKSFLMTKLVGNTAGSLAFVPQQGSIIFHYGRHIDDEVRAIASTLKEAINLINQRRNARYSLNSLRKLKKETLDKLEKASAQKRLELEAQRTKIDEDLELEQKNVKIFDRMMGELLKGKVDIVEDPAITLFSEANIKIDEAENHVFGIGLGDYRLMVFILPEFRNMVDKKPHNFIQEKFNESRVTVLMLLSFLRKLCGCDGPYYYMCIPSLSAENFSNDAFYVRDKRYSSKEVCEYYEAFASFCNRVIGANEDKNRRMVKRLLLSERMVEDPLSTLSEVMRRSEVFSDEVKNGYMTIFDPISRRPDLDKYFEVFMKARLYMVSKVEEVCR